jgi:UDP-N-acetylmuramate--alanine ligase
MKGLAEVLSDLGCRVTGSDLSLRADQTAHFARRGIVVSQGHAPTQLPADADWLVFSPAVPESNPEREQARRLGMCQLPLSQACGRLMISREGISIAGTHGKSTTTALLGHLLDVAGRAPTVLCGAEVVGREVNGWAGTGPLLVIESCEYRRHFLELCPRHVVLLNIEPDHFDCFPTVDDAARTYAEFVSRLPASGTLVINADAPRVSEAARHTRARVITIGEGDSVDWTLCETVRTGERQQLTLRRPDGRAEVYDVSLPGRHQALGALAVVALANQLGVDRSAVASGLQTFRGIRRRLERLGEWQGIMLYDDYAHHPTAVSATLATIRALIGPRRLWVAFQPHQLSRTRALLGEFAAAFGSADEVLVLPVFAARETDEAAGTTALAGELVRCLVQSGQRARLVESLDRVVETIETSVPPGDVVVIMGAGSIERIGHEFSERIRRDRPA